MSYYPPRKIITAEERTVVNSEVEQDNARQDRELKENVSTTGPGLFESQNKLFRSEFDPSTAGEDNANQFINGADRSRNSVGSEDQIGITQSTPPGTPSQQTLDRLRAAVSKSPRGISRADFRWNEKLGVDGLILLEINTQPGMTPTSLVPEQAEICGVKFGELCKWLVEDASCDR